MLVSCHFNIKYLRKRISDWNNFFSSGIFRARARTYWIYKAIQAYDLANRATLNKRHCYMLSQKFYFTLNYCCFSTMIALEICVLPMQTYHFWGVTTSTVWPTSSITGFNHFCCLNPSSSITARAIRVARPLFTKKFLSPYREKRGKDKMEKERREIVKGKVENWKCFAFHFWKPLKFVWGLPKWKFLPAKSILHWEEIMKSDFAPWKIFVLHCWLLLWFGHSMHMYLCVCCNHSKSVMELSVSQKLQALANVVHS